MKLKTNTSYQNKLKRLNTQMELSNEILRNHPSVDGRLVILQALLHNLQLHMQWILSGSSARLLMTLQTALFAYETEKSQTGFMGPTLKQMRNTIHQTIAAVLKQEEKESAHFLAILTEIMTIGIIYIENLLKHQGNQMYASQDEKAKRKSASFLQELGLTYFLGTKIIESCFLSVCKGLNISDISGLKVKDIGTFFIYAILLMKAELEEVNESEVVELIEESMQPLLDSVEYAFNELYSKEPTKEMERVLNDCRELKKGIERQKRISIENILMGTVGYRMHKEKMRTELMQLNQFCSQLNNSLNNIFYRTEQMGTVMQVI